MTFFDARTLTGVSHLLYALDEGGHWLVPTCLSCLADLLCSDEALTDFLEWHSRQNGQNAVQLLLGLWRQAEASPLETKLASDSSSSSSPAAGRSSSSLQRSPPSSALARQRTPEVITLHDVQASMKTPDPLEVMEKLPPSTLHDALQDVDIKSKIHAVLTHVTEELLSEVRDSLTLNAQDSALLVQVRAHAQSVVGSSWDIVRQRMLRDGVRPIAPDRDRIDQHLTLATETKAEVEEMKTAIDGIRDVIEAEEEEFTYRNLFNKPKEREIAAIAIGIVEANRRRKSMLENSLRVKEEGEHRLVVEAMEAKRERRRQPLTPQQYIDLVTGP